MERPETQHGSITETFRLLRNASLMLENGELTEICSCTGIQESISNKENAFLYAPEKLRLSFFFRKILEDSNNDGENKGVA
jgi:hypothetical protein